MTMAKLAVCEDLRARKPFKGIMKMAAETIAGLLTVIVSVHVASALRLF